MIAEVELADPEQRIELPPWVGEEITLNPRYGNSTLARLPIRDRRVAVAGSDHLWPGGGGWRVTPIQSSPRSVADNGGSG